MNEAEIKEDDGKSYEAPELLELGRAEELTYGRAGDWPDGLNRWVFAP